MIYTSSREMDMTVIADFSKCQVIQEAAGEGFAYRVMSKNNICLYHTAKAVKAIQYAEWFEGKQK